MKLFTKDTSKYGMRIRELLDEFYQRQPQVRGGPRQGRRGPLDPSLNQAILHMAKLIFPKGFQVQHADDKTAQQVWKRFDAGEFVAPSNNSGYTVFDDPQVNYAMRAWHDWTHWKLRRTFQNVHENQVNDQQKRDLIKVFGRTPQTMRWCKILDADTVGQLQYKKKYGDFPVDQHAFVLAYLNGGGLDRRY